MILNVISVLGLRSAGMEDKFPETYVEAFPHGSGKYLDPGVFVMWPSGEVTIVSKKADGCTITHFSVPGAMFFRSFYDRAIEAKMKAEVAVAT